MMPETAYIGLDNNPIDKADDPLIYAAISAKCSDDGQLKTRVPIIIKAYVFSVLRAGTGISTALPAKTSRAMRNSEVDGLVQMRSTLRFAAMSGCTQRGF